MTKKVSNNKPLVGNKRSHALNATKKMQKVNMQKKTINGHKELISTRDYRTISKAN